MIKFNRFRSLVLLSLLMTATLAKSDSLPKDVRDNHWAANAVSACLKNDTISLQSDRQFHGDAKVSRTEVALSLAKLAQRITKGAWIVGSSKPISGKVVKTWETTDWKKQPVRRYALAAILSRFADYYVKSIKKPAAGTKELGKSEVLKSVTVALEKSDPAYEAVSFLARYRMIQPGSPLLKPGDQPVTGLEMSRLLKDLALGMIDQDSELGLDENGSTIDKNSRKPKPQK